MTIRVYFCTIASTKFKYWSFRFLRECWTVRDRKFPITVITKTLLFSNFKRQLVNLKYLVWFKSLADGLIPSNPKLNLESESQEYIDFPRNMSEWEQTILCGYCLQIFSVSLNFNCSFMNPLVSSCWESVINVCIIFLTLDYSESVGVWRYKTVSVGVELKPLLLTL